ncbi:MAG: hypothetical protein OHK0039_28070 [Bacteroidia bacterium]
MYVFWNGLYAQPGRGNDPFTDVSAYEIGDLARQAGKPYIIFFYTSDCPPCQHMLDSTLSDPDMRDYLAANYLIIQVDVERDRWRGQAGDFDSLRITFYPTTMVFSPEGRLMMRFVGQAEKQRMLADLKACRRRMKLDPPLVGDTPPDLPAPATAPQPEAIPEITEPPVRPEPTAAPDPIVITQPEVVPTTPRRVDPVATTTYWVQVGAFSDEPSARKKIDALSGAGYSRMPMRVQTAVVGGRTYYRVQMGAFTSKHDADVLMSNYRLQGGQAIVVVERP